MKTQVPPPISATKLLTIPAVAESLSLTPRAVYNLIYAGKLRRVKIGQSSRIRVSDVVALVENGCPTATGNKATRLSKSALSAMTAGACRLGAAGKVGAA